MEKKKQKRLSPLLIAFFILIGITLILCAAVFGLWFHGRNSLNQPAEAPALPQTQVSEEPSGDFVEYNGKRYRYNENMRNILLMGIDSAETPSDTAESHDQADVLVLAALDLASNQMTLISISRDTMCDMELLDENGNRTGLMHAQVALAYAYGNSQARSCEVCRDAVSNIFYGLPIHGYAAYYMSGIPELNHAVGGVTVNILDDYPFTNIAECANMYPGHDVTLTDKQALYYIRCRLSEPANANQLRMQRQKQYMLALISKAKQLVAENPTSLLFLYNAVSDYVITDLDLGRISYLATKAASMDFSGDIRSLEGELSIGKHDYVEFTLDQDSLFELMLEVFYTEVEPENQGEASLS